MIRVHSSHLEALSSYIMELPSTMASPFLSHSTFPFHLCWESHHNSEWWALGSCQVHVQTIWWLPDRQSPSLPTRDFPGVASSQKQQWDVCILDDVCREDIVSCHWVYVCCQHSLWNIQTICGCHGEAKLIGGLNCAIWIIKCLPPPARQGACCRVPRHSLGFGTHSWSCSLGLISD